MSIALLWWLLPDGKGYMFSVYIEIPNCAAEQGQQMAKWAIETGSGLFLLVSFLLTYRQSVNTRAGDLLLKLEEAFTILSDKLAFLEYKRTCYDPIKEIMVKYARDPDELSESERKTLADIDSCLRFLYLCTLHAGDKIPDPNKRSVATFFFGSRLPRAYYFYLNKLNNEKDRPELYAYVRQFFPTLWHWLDSNRSVLMSYGA